MNENASTSSRPMLESALVNRRLKLTELSATKPKYAVSQLQDPVGGSDSGVYVPGFFLGGGRRG